MHKSALIKISLVSLLLFFIILPLSLKVTFQQNDDYAYYKMLNFFVKRNFFLVQETSASFYTQGIISIPFALLFGIERMPILTLIFSVLNFFLFSYICFKYYLKNVTDSILVGLLFFFNPLHVYSIFGYMTENYFTFFLLLIIFCFKRYEEKNNNLNLILLNLSIFAGFMLRQFSMLTALAISIYYLYKKKYKVALIQLGVFVGILLYYQFIFPQTPDMRDSSDRNILIFLDFQRLFSTTTAFLLYLSAFSFPLIFVLAKESKSWFKNKFFWFFIILFSIGIFYFFIPVKRLDDNIFYLRNTVSRSGFIFTSLLGDIGSINFRFPYFEIWDFLAKSSLIILLSLFLFLRKQLISMYSIFIVIYLGLILTFTSIYDRYALPILIFGILFIVSLVKNGLGKFGRIFIIFYLIFVCLFNYQASMRFVLANKSMWDRAISLTKEKNISKNRIMQGYPWFMLYPIRDEYIYMFSFSERNKEVNPEKFQIIEKNSIDFPFNAYPSSYYYIFLRNTYYDKMTK